jgi:hypothetical protein
MKKILKVGNRSKNIHTRVRLLLLTRAFLNGRKPCLFVYFGQLTFSCIRIRIHIPNGEYESGSWTANQCGSTTLIYNSTIWYCTILHPSMCIGPVFWKVEVWYVYFPYKNGKASNCCPNFRWFFSKLNTSPVFVCIFCIKSYGGESGSGDLSLAVYSIICSTRHHPSFFP